MKTWDECKPLVIGVKGGCEHEGFETRAEADSFIREARERASASAAASRALVVGAGAAQGFISARAFQQQRAGAGAGKRLSPDSARHMTPSKRPRTSGSGLTPAMRAARLAEDDLFGGNSDYSPQVARQMSQQWAAEEERQRALALARVDAAINMFRRRRAAAVKIQAVARGRAVRESVEVEISAESCYRADDGSYQESNDGEEERRVDVAHALVAADRLRSGQDSSADDVPAQDFIRVDVAPAAAPARAETAPAFEPDQERVLKLADEGRNIFFTGSGGVGKSFVAEEIIKRKKEKGVKVCVTAPTGIAGSHLDGTTIHSAAGCGVHKYVSDFGKMWNKKEYWRGNPEKRIPPVGLLIIDEVSMLSGEFFDNFIARLSEILNEKAVENADEDGPGRRATQCLPGQLHLSGLQNNHNNDNAPRVKLPQIIVMGDFFQLPPIVEKANATETRTFLNPQDSIPACVLRGTTFLVPTETGEDRKYPFAEKRGMFAMPNGTSVEQESRLGLSIRGVARA